MILYFINIKNVSSFVGYPLLSAGGMIMTVVIAPLTILLKQLLEKFGPVAEF